MRQPTHPKLRWLLQLTAALKFFTYPYSPVLAPSDFYMFPKLKTKLRGIRFGCYEGVMEALNDFFEDQNKEFNSEELNKFEHRWAKCIDVESDYIEK
jgi:hypothetical protein